MRVNTREDFENHIAKTENCWLWTGTQTQSGYGTFKFQGKQWRAHRLSYYFAHGDLPVDELVCHHCDNPLCVNPDHLFLGTAQDNSADMISKGRGARGEKQGSVKLTEADVLAIRAEYVPYKNSEPKLAKKYRVSHSQIHKILKDRRWRHI